MTLLQELVAGCKASVTITVNDHRDVYYPVRDYVLEECVSRNQMPTEAILSRMVETDTIVLIQFYPQSPTSFYDIWHYDVELGLQAAVELLRELQAKGEA